MPRAEKPEILKWLHRREFGGIVSVRQVLQEGARVVLGKQPDLAEAYAETNLTAFWNLILELQSDHERRGLRRSFDVIDASARTLAWYGVGSVLSHLRADVRAFARLRHRPAMLGMIDALSDREYEALGCLVSQLAGAVNVYLGPGGNEGGIDFFAVIPPFGRCHLFSGGIHPLRIVGQCKQYKDRVPVGVMKEFLQTLANVKHRGESAIEAIVPPWFHAVRGPIVGLVIGHSGFQSGADTTARNHGVLLADSYDVAEILALSRSVPQEKGAHARASAYRDRVKGFFPATAASPSPS
jgi:hypothetical protein